MNSPSPADFDRIALQAFSSLITRCGYDLAQTESAPFRVVHIYENASINRKIEVSNATYSVDYGFSVFIYNTAANEYNIVYNLPHEKQDRNGDFVLRASQELFNTEEVVQLISGTSWKRFGQIYFQY
jgi:hypothetical protein